MIRSSEELLAFERRQARRAQGKDFQEALDAFAALWEHARLLNPDFTAGWEEDLAADLELVRVLRALPEPA